MSSRPKQLGISVENICYYFDGVERERMDVGGLNRKAGEWLALRTKLLKLPESAFEVVIKSVHSLVDNIASEVPEEQTDSKKIADRKRAVALFERVAQADNFGNSTNNSSGQSVGETSQISL